MRRFLTIMLSFALYLLWGVSDCALSDAGRLKAESQVSASVAEDSASAESRGQNASYVEQGTTLLTPNTSRSNVVNSPTTVKTNSGSARLSVRQKIESEKMLSAAVHQRHAGHITHIVEYSYFRSSLRVAYYIYTLCRLRI